MCARDQAQVFMLARQELHPQPHFISFDNCHSSLLIKAFSSLGWAHAEFEVLFGNEPMFSHILGVLVLGIQIEGLHRKREPK
jgi:hypothetical protein